MMAVLSEQVADVTVARVDADIDAASAGAVGDRLALSIPHDGSALVVDLTGCLYLDSAGIDMLFRLGARLRARRRTLLVVIPPTSPLIRLAEIVGLGREIALHATVEEALGRPMPRAGGLRGVR